ncbi:MAG: Fic family protein [Candidatus Glassbacteria bacterium]
MNRAATDTTLWDWRYGQAQAERLCADLLQVEGFIDIDPQSPLGGPDGRKDILCTRDGEDWLAGVYFPPTRSEFADIQEKFQHDYEGVARYSSKGFIFFTNQPITPGKRAQLCRHAEPVPVELYHQERIRSILDSPKGYGFRLEYLRIPMTEEEQYSLWSTLKDDITTRLTRQEGHILDLHRKMDLMLERTMEIASNLLVQRSSIEASPPPPLTQFPTADLRVGDVLWIHRLLSDGTTLPHTNRGRFRNVSVWIGKAGSIPETARFTPPLPDRTPALLEELTSQWRANYTRVSGAEEDVRIYALSSFHHGFLSIHPFLDGNGRVARALLQQQAFELLGRYLEATFTEDPVAYYDALFAADKGDLEPLTRLIQANLE